jgi:hypothetical protein
MTIQPICKCGHRKHWHHYVEHKATKCMFMECDCKEYRPDILYEPPKDYEETTK